MLWVRGQATTEITAAPFPGAAENSTLAGNQEVGFSGEMKIQSGRLPLCESGLSGPKSIVGFHVEKL
jgi:hypothetical protein